MKLEELGWTSYQADYVNSIDSVDFEAGRIIAVHRDRYVVRTTENILDAEITGNLRFTATSASDFPAVGDWVSLLPFDGLAIINEILPRKNAIERKAVGKSGEKQLIAANVDYSFIVQAADKDFNINRLERYLAISRISGIQPVLVLNKIDLVSESELQDKIDSVKKRHPDLKIIAMSNITRKGYEEFDNVLKKAKTYCFLGSSGVGKSTLINYLLGADIMKTRSLSDATGKGKHTTSHRELFILDNGAIVIDTPGMREVGITENVESSFDQFTELSSECRFSDCTHTHETGCAILEALNDGIIDRGSYDNYLKMKREEAHYQSTLAEKRKKDKKTGKLYKQVIAYKKRTKK